MTNDGVSRHVFSEGCSPGYEGFCGAILQKQDRKV